METATTFTPAELKALRRAFQVKTATPDEVCLTIRPLRRSVFVWACGLGWVLILGFGFGLGVGDSACTRFTQEVRRVLAPRFWNVCLPLGALIVLFFGVLPHLYRPVFRLFIRPAGGPVRMRGFGYEQERESGFCRVRKRLLGCGVRIDDVPYSIARRWWQIGPTGKAVAALQNALDPGQGTLRATVSAGQMSEMLRSGDRTLWASCFGEALITSNEAVLLLPPPMWHMWWTGAFGFFASMSLVFGNTLVPEVFELTPGFGIGYPFWVNPVLMFLPSGVMVTIAGLVAICADPWFRRAVAVVPRGQQRIQIRIGGRQITDSPLLPEMIWAEDANQREHDTGIDRVGLCVPGWHGQRSCRLKVGLIQAAVDRLYIWASTPASSESEPHA
jgi:hypothetical protein